MTSAQKAQTRVEAIALDKPRVLIVDDSRTMRVSVQRLLGKEFDVVEAADVDSAWELLTSDDTIQVVFADLMMPDKNGFQLLRQMRESPHQRLVNLPLIVITGHDDSDKMMRQAMLLGASDFISKPFNSIQILTRARAHAKYQDTSRKLQEAQARLTKGGTLDTLTGLANRRYFSEQGPSMLAFAARESKNLAVLRLDIDRFETLFRKKGKLIADKILLHITKIINACVREEDRVARVGLAKFAIVMPGVDEDGARRAAKRIHQLIQKTSYRIGEARFRMTASAALVTSAAERQMEFHGLVKLAEQRLKQAAFAGGNRLVLAPEPAAAAPPAASIADTKTEVSPTPSITAEAALAMLAADQRKALRDRIRPLLADLYPLLEYANRELGLGLDDARLKEKLGLGTAESAVTLTE